MNVLQERFKDSMDQVIPRENRRLSRSFKKEEEDVFGIEEFLENLKEGKRNFTNSNS